MHLAIMSLSQGTPAITLATQGKVEGLVRLFDWPQLCIAPKAGMAEDIVEVAGAALDDKRSRTRVLAGTDRARSMAWANVSRIGGGESLARTAEISGLGGRDG